MSVDIESDCIDSQLLCQPNISEQPKFCNKCKTEVNLIIFLGKSEKSANKSSIF